MTDELAAILQHDFKDSAVLTKALTHGSVLSLVVAEMLYASFTDENEGKLARRSAALVRRETLAEVAAEIGLGSYIVLSSGEAVAGGRENPSLLADVCESVIAALYLDGGLAAADRFIRRYWQSRMERSDSPPLDSKTALQEWAQGRGMPLPAYRIAKREGPYHAPVFTIAVSVGDGPVATGEGHTRRSAEQAAAGTLLQRMQRDD
jgi:ribonuclease-3